MREHERIDRPGGLKLTGIYEKMEVNCVKLRTGISSRLRVRRRRDIFQPLKGRARKNC